MGVIMAKLKQFLDGGRSLGKNAVLEELNRVSEEFKLNVDSARSNMIVKRDTSVNLPIDNNVIIIDGYIFQHINNIEIR